MAEVSSGASIVMVWMREDAEESLSGKVRLDFARKGENGADVLSSRAQALRSRCALPLSMLLGARTQHCAG